MEKRLTRSKYRLEWWIGWVQKPSVWVQILHGNGQIFRRNRTVHAKENVASSVQKRLNRTSSRFWLWVGWAQEIVHLMGVDIGATWQIRFTDCAPRLWAGLSPGWRCGLFPNYFWAILLNIFVHCPMSDMLITIRVTRCNSVRDLSRVYLEVYMVDHACLKSVQWGMRTFWRQFLGRFADKCLNLYVKMYSILARLDRLI